MGTQYKTGAIHTSFTHINICHSQTDQLNCLTQPIFQLIINFNEDVINIQQTAVQHIKIKCTLLKYFHSFAQIFWFARVWDVPIPRSSSPTGHLAIANPDLKMASSKMSSYKYVCFKSSSFVFWYMRKCLCLCGNMNFTQQRMATSPLISQARIKVHLDWLVQPIC